MIERLYHLYEDLGIYKAAIKNSIAYHKGMLSADDFQERGYAEAEALLAQRRSKYSRSEVELLLGCYVTAHDECVTDFPEDFEPLQVHVANQKIERLERALQVINQPAVI